jgi:hypothetical protein
VTVHLERGDLNNQSAINIMLKLSKMNSYNKSQRDALFVKFILIKNSTCFGQICYPSTGVSTLYTQQQVFVMLVMLTVC